MKRTFALIAVVMMTAAGTAQQPASIEHSQVSCMRADAMPVLTMRLNGGTEKGELRAYFRRAGTSDWCMVVGENEGLASNATLPVFEEGVELEYYFLVVEGKRVVARSPKIYRSKVTDSCENPSARHFVMMRLDCSQRGASSLPSAMGAGFAVADEVVRNRPPSPTPDNPGNGAN